jgi:raffinose/stachyose/melibiose transport system substrate-binding protein
MLMKTLAGAGLALAIGVSAAYAADTKVWVLHASQTSDVYFKQVAEAYNKAHPGVQVVVDYMEGEAYKQKLPTLLQSADKPALIYSWAGGVLRAQVAAGFLTDLTPVKADFAKQYYPAAFDTYAVDGKQYGVPMILGDVSIIYNKDLLAKAGVDPASMGTWDGFLAAVKKIKAAGIIPLAMGGADKWPMHFYWSYLLLRSGGADVLATAEKTPKTGFTAAPFVEAGKRLKELAALEPWQEGWLGTKNIPAQGIFGDGKAAMALQLNGFLLGQQKNATDGKGIPLEKIGRAPFPTLPGGKGKTTDVLGGVQGFLVTKGAPKEALDFLKFFSQADNHKAAAESGTYLPAVVGTDAFIKTPLFADVAKTIAGASSLQNFLDQDLGPSVGRTVNDVSVGIAAGDITPEDGAKQIQEAWDQL